MSSHAFLEILILIYLLVNKRNSGLLLAKLPEKKKNLEFSRLRYFTFVMAELQIKK